MPNRKKKIDLRYTGLGLMLLLFGCMNLYALTPDSYVSNSVLADGKWAKIEVGETGMQFVSDATIRSLGFSDPEKVNVYGYGGIMIPENLNSPDDLPLLPSLRINGGILFFGKGISGWNIKGNNGREYQHETNVYSDKSYYFLSDRDDSRKSPSKSDKTYISRDVITSFMERKLHEQDLMAPVSSGRFYFGEDFKTQTNRNFKFDLTDNIGDVTATISFGCKTSGGTSSLTISANGVALNATSTDRLNYSSSKLIVTTTTVKKISDPGTSLDLGIKYNGSGIVSVAALDYIEIEYPRALNITDGELYFYIDPDVPSEVRIEGATGSTVLWDVTDPENPVEISTTKSGNTMSFVARTSYGEYVAFEPSKITRPVVSAGAVENQDLHSLSAPGLLVICPEEYLSAARRLEGIHRDTDGLSVTFLTPEKIYNEFSSGVPDVSAFRKLLKMWYDRAEGREGEYTAYCLIFSRPTVDNKKVTAIVRNCGYPRVPIWQSASGDTEATSYSTDDYIGMLADVKGTFNIGNAKIHTAVGRMPVKSLNEANLVLDKLEQYLLNPDKGGWKNNVMVIADDQDNGVHLTQAENVIKSMKSGDRGNDFLYEKLYLDSYELEFTSVGASYPRAHQRMLNKWNEGTALINYIGHANTKAWGHENLLTWTDINAMSNKRLPYLIAATCDFMKWDDEDISGAEALWSLPASGVIGMICPSREVLIASNGVLNPAMSKYIFSTDDNGRSMRVGDILRMGKNDSNTGNNKLRYGILGDPSMRLPWPSLRVEGDTINGIALASADKYPEIKARSTVKLSGTIKDENYTKVNDFNGIVEVQLYDAERVITTNGNGSDGVKSIYNDRKTRLYVGRTKVADGEWKIEFTMPSEIENNYSPALLSFYAYADDGREGNGSSEKLYAYGYDEAVPDDYEGPKIIEFYLNSPSFVSGGQVSPNPVLTAKFMDESGISVSEAGIGHSISLDIDGKTYFDDVAQYYVPDENDWNAGSVVYPLTNLEQGDHTLRFIVWDNANNSTTATLDFTISALWKPTIETLTTDINPATSSVNFIVATDGSTKSMDCVIEVYDLWGKKIWREQAPSLTGTSTRTTLNWNLTDFGGARIPGGIYLYRATVKTDSGATVSKTKKLVVCSQ